MSGAVAHDALQDAMSGMEDEPKADTIQYIPGMMVISAMAVAAVMVVGVVTFRRVARQEEALPFVAMSTNFKPLDAVHAH